MTNHHHLDRKPTTMTNTMIAAGPDTPGAVLTHCGNYIVPASTDGTTQCRTCNHVMPVTKFPTKPALPDGTVTRDNRCRACRDATTVARKTAVAVPVADRGIITPTGAFVPTTGAVPVPTIIVADPPADAPKRPTMTTVFASASATWDAMADASPNGVANPFVAALAARGAAA